MDVDSGFRIFVLYCFLLIVWIVYGWMRGHYAGLLKYFVIAFDCWIIAWNLWSCACYLYLYYPWTLRTMSNLGLGVHLRITMMFGFQNCVTMMFGFQKLCAKFFNFLWYCHSWACFACGDWSLHDIVRNCAFLQVFGFD